jgi:hypothetical protein
LNKKQKLSIIFKNLFKEKFDILEGLEFDSSKFVRIFEFIFKI